MTVDHVFPEDQGTGATEGDDADAANFAAFNDHPNLRDYIAAGLTLTVDYATPQFDLSAGKIFLTTSAATTAQTGESRDQGVLFEVEVSARTGVALTDADTNHVYIQADLSTDDTVNVIVNTTGTPPAEPSLKIAEVDTSGDTKDEGFNRDPATSHSTVDATSTITAQGSPAIDAQGNIDVATGSAIRDGSGTPRYELLSSVTEMNDESGTAVFQTSGGVNETRVYASSTRPVSIFDREGGFRGVQYNTSATSPGTLELTNSTLDANDNTIEGVEVLQMEDRDANGSPWRILEDATGGQLNFIEQGVSTRLSLNAGGPVEIPNGDLRLATGQSIEDGSGTSRFSLDGNATVIRDNTGSLSNSILLSDGNYTRIQADVGAPFQIRDEEGGFQGVQYDTDPSSGVLRTPNAGMNIESGGFATGVQGLRLQWISGSPDRARLWAWDDINSTSRPLILRGSLIDFSEGNGADLRLATGQAIEDGSGTNRFEITSNQTSIYDEAGSKAVDFLNGSAYFHKSRSGTPFIIQDMEGTFDAVKYLTSPSAPGTLELTNANLDANGNDVTNVGSINTEEASITEGSARVYPTVDQSIPNSTATTIEFDNQDVDHTTGDVLTVDSANNKIVIEKAGRYIISATADIQNPGDGTRLQCTIRLGTDTNGTGLARDDTQTGADDFASVNPVVVHEVTSSETPQDVTFDVFQESGGSVSVFGQGGYTQLSIGRIG